MQTLRIRHNTTYRYNQPVRLGEHRAMIRPRDSHDIRLLATRLTLSPPADVRWMHDVFSNSIAVARFQDQTTSELVIESEITLEHYGYQHPDCPIDEFAATYPFSYPADQIPDLGRTAERHYDDSDGAVQQWAKRFVAAAGVPCDTQSLLSIMNQAIKDDFAYVVRHEPGTQAPGETLATRRGSCRDYALFFMEAARSLGFAARFVSGYLYDPYADPSVLSAATAGATHAWVQVYLPGAGWVEYDPTNGLVGGQSLIRVAVAREPTQAVPIAGTFFGAPDAFQALDVQVDVTAL